YITLRLLACSAPVAHRGVLGLSEPPVPLAESFFLKGVLFFLVRLGMTRTRSQLAPAMSMQKPVDAVDMHFMVHLRFQGLLDLLDCGNLALFGSREEGLE